ncbi:MULTISPECIES: class F sortase [Streptomyces]|jgi:LPXTG-site transpeptidase (sortase) family protein|uniref:Class F sortase n=1 Tax=Streptomyces doudnae TaxID=3075536 RepID=A0ABD5ENK6_9ACTN|nr:MULTISPECIES: class F sortase [unclassified Streptomyces]MDT0434977.1 class F sortase [Streptomyces sp. DSM 41981]MYQ64391.1 class F sortase [Streptomyces sp. SID4950]SCD78135.1 LPXTG-site transpeptidase (sortase) family protein [Streptomyces sp. SolWspMP-5a-2]
MSPFSRRAFLGAAAVSLVAGCGPGDGTGVRTEGEGGAGSTGGDGSGAGNSGTSPSAPAGSAPPTAGSPPVRLLIPAIHVDTPLLRLGLAADGTVQVPPITAHDRAGWYRHSPAPGQTGPSVILGHVTVGSFGDGVFRHLSELRRGDTIEARLEKGGPARFEVTAVRTVAKSAFPTQEVYGDVDRPELRLITCGGAHDGDGYADNVIVFAAPAADPT